MHDTAEREHRSSDASRSNDRRHRFGVSIGAVVLATAGLAVLAAGANASGSAQGPPAAPATPPFVQCPAIGHDTSCEVLIDVTSSETPPEILVDKAQTFYDGDDDVTVGIQNDSKAPLSSVHLGVAGSGDGIFGLDGDGLCSVGIAPKPEGCPFGPPGNLGDPFDYYGPDTVLTAEPGSVEAGTVSFETPLAPGQYTYFSLESPPAGAKVVAGEVNDIVSTQLTNVVTGEFGATITAPVHVNVTDTATITGPNAAFAGGEVTYNVYSDPACDTKVGVSSTKKVKAGTAERSTPVGLELEDNHTYYWLVEFTGNGGSEKEKNSKSVSACGSETMTFGTPLAPAQPTVATVLAGAGRTGSTITVPLGTAVTDTATVIAPGGQPVSGRLTYAGYTASTCAASTQLKGVGGGGLTTGSGPPSNALTLPAGTYYFVAFYSGNGTLNHAVTACGSEVLTVAAPPAPPPNSQFTLVGKPKVNERTGEIIIVGRFPAKGKATASGAVQQGATLARVERILAEGARRKKCKRGFVRKHKRCLSNAPVLYGVSTVAISTPGTYMIVIKPTARVLRALRRGKRLNVTVSTTFQNSAGGLPVTHVQSVLVKLKRRQKHKKH